MESSGKADSERAEGGDGVCAPPGTVWRLKPGITEVLLLRDTNTVGEEKYSLSLKVSRLQVNVI